MLVSVKFTSCDCIILIKFLVILSSHASTIGFPWMRFFCCPILFHFTYENIGSREVSKICFKIQLKIAALHLPWIEGHKVNWCLFKWAFWLLSQQHTHTHTRKKKQRLYLIKVVRCIKVPWNYMNRVV